MYQAVQAGLQLHKGAEVGDPDHLALHDAAFRILLGGVIPGPGLQLLVAQLNAVAFRIQAQDLDVHFLVGLHDVAGMLHAAPAQVGDMDQAIYAAQVDEGAEVGQPAHDPVDHDAFFQLVPYFLLLRGGFFNRHGLAAGDDALLLLVHFDDLQLHGFADEVADLLDVPLAQLAGRYERADAVHGADQAALDGFLAHCVDVFARFPLGHHGVPRLAIDDIALAQQHIAVAVVYLHDFDFNLVSQLNVLVHQVFPLDQPVGLVADIDAHFVIGDLDHLAGDRLSRTDPDHCGLDLLHEVIVVVLLFGGRGQGLVFQLAHSCDNLLK